MQNNAFDVYTSNNAASPYSADITTPTYVINKQLGATATGGTKVFALLGAGSLQGSDAAEALVAAINDPNVDDTYTKLQFLMENPVITITPVGDRHVGDKFTIAATTNLAVDDEILCQVYSSSFKPTMKSQSGEFSGTTGTVKVTKGDGGLNKISFDVNAATFKPDEYIVQESAVIQTATATALFNVLEGSAPIAPPTTTVVVTTAVPVTQVVTTVVPPTTVPPTKAPTQPGFGALVALIGLGAVALLVVRRH
jgi:PGF-CTERM protein